MLIDERPQTAPILPAGTKPGPNPLKTLGHGTKIAATYPPLHCPSARRADATKSRNALAGEGLGGRPPRDCFRRGAFSRTRRGPACFWPANSYNSAFHFPATVGLRPL